jgi:GNAT superfamily N-acetyltransferase
MARHELWVELADRPGNLAALAGDLAACGANIVHLDVHPGPGDTVIDRLVVQVPDARSDDLAAVAARYRAAASPADQVLPRPTPPPRRPGPARRPPTTLERLVALADGGLVRLRHLSAGDREEVVAHHARCSDATRRHSRFLVAETLPPGRDGTYPGGDGRHRVALAALVGADIVGVARYDLDRSPAVADLAVMVEDRHQRRGIGTLLVTELALLASNAEVRHLRSVDRSGGDRLAGTLRRAGLACSMRRDGESLVLDCALPQGLSASA